MKQELIDKIVKEFEEEYPNDNEFCCCSREYCYPANFQNYEPLLRIQSFLIQAISTAYDEGDKVAIQDSLKAFADLKAKYINDGYQSCLREVKARVGSVNAIALGVDIKIRHEDYAKSWNDCLDEIKKLINEV